MKKLVLSYALLVASLAVILDGPSSLAQTLPASATSAPTFSRDVPQDVVDQTKDDLVFLKGVQGTGSTPLYHEMFGADVDGTNLDSFFSQRIHRFDMNDCGGGPAVGACVIPWLNSNTMWLTQNYVTFKIPQIFRVSIILHESRHSEDDHGNWMHADCPVPFLDENGKDIRGIISGTKLEGAPACDDTVYGSYGLEAVFLKNIELHCANCSEKVKMDAKLFGEDGVLRISNKAAYSQIKKDLGIQ